MAIATAAQFSYSLTLFGSRESRRKSSAGGSRNVSFQMVYASQGSPGNRRKAPPGVDTRIHWENEEDGWIGGNTSSRSSSSSTSTASQQDLLGDKFSDLLNDYSDSHYQYVYVCVYMSL